MFTEPIAYLEKLDAGEEYCLEYNVTIPGCFEGEITNYVNVTARCGNKTYCASANCTVVIENNGNVETKCGATETEEIALQSICMGVLACAVCIACVSWFAFGRGRK
jgi:hypothetical protein